MEDRNRLQGLIKKKLQSCGSIFNYRVTDKHSISAERIRSEARCKCSTNMITYNNNWNWCLDFVLVSARQLCIATFYNP